MSPVRSTLYLLAIILLGTMNTYAQTFSLDAHRWKHRVLLVFAASDQDPRLEQQRTLFAREDAAFQERDLLLLELVGTEQGAIRRFGQQETTQSMSADAVEQMRDRFTVPLDTFAVVLIGKDGTEKVRFEAPAKPQAVYERIDAMPMRQREMKERQAKKQQAP